eukprot:3824470-Pleurochrysis_carterae.AAC.2
MLIRVVVSYIEDKQPGASLSDVQAYLVTASMFGVACVQSLALGQYFWRGFRLGLRLRVAIGQA